jgi:hypothetical protein
MATANSAQAPRVVQQQQQVLSICVPLVSTAKDLIRIGLASKQTRDDVVVYVQQQLPSLVDVAVSTGNLPDSQQSRTYWGGTEQLLLNAITRPLKWLLATAGPAAVAAPAVTLTLLRVTQVIPRELHETLPAMAYQYGLQLSIAQLVAASKQQLRGMDKWIKTAGQQMPADNPAIGDTDSTFLQCMVTFCSERPSYVRIYIPPTAPCFAEWSSAACKLLMIWQSHSQRVHVAGVCMHSMPTTL